MALIGKEQYLKSRKILARDALDTKKKLRGKKPKRDSI